MRRPSAPARSSVIMALLSALLAITIFVIDTVTPLDIAVAVLYVAVVLLAMDFTGRQGILLVAAGCAVLTVLSYFVTHGDDWTSGPVLRCLISLSAIAITAVLAARNQRALADVREHANLLDLTHDTIFVRDRDDVITYWNRAATELYGWNSEQAIGRQAADLLQTQFPAPRADIWSSLERDGRWEGELIHTARDGRRVTVASRWALQRDNRGRTLATLETNNDITERRGVEDRLSRASSELAHVSRIATLGELTASIAHEVNQPLAAIVANGEAGLRWLKRDVPDLVEVRNSVERMIRNGQRASEVVKRLRALARKSDPVHTAIAMADVVNEAALLIGRELLVHRVTLSVNASAALPQVRADRVQLQQVVINLLMNGIQAMDGVTERARALSIETASSADGVVVTVSDNGPGIAAENLVRLFDAFFSTKSDGMGMGLSICRSIVEAHGGRIWATNREGTGASFHFSLPAFEGSEA